tara:strand:- start:1031 stop:1855 length:825 start_codon:yes stop_codon:yes gene_type:complete
VSRRITIRGASFNVDAGGDASFSDIRGKRIRSFWEHACSGAWESESFAAIDRFCPPDAAFIDLGAWIGPLSLYAAARGAAVYSFEPDPAACHKLKLNVAANPTLNVEIQEKAVTRLGAAVTLYSEAAGDSQSSTFNLRERGGKVIKALPVCTATSVALQQTLQRIARHHARLFLKVDVEGGEYGLLEGLSARDLSPVSHICLSLHPENIVDGLRGDPEAARSLRAAHSLKLVPLFKTCRILRAGEHGWVDYAYTNIVEDISKSGSPRTPLMLEL